MGLWVGHCYESCIPPCCSWFDEKLTEIEVAELKLIVYAAATVGGAIVRIARKTVAVIECCIEDAGLNAAT